MFPQSVLTGWALYWRRNDFPVMYQLYILPTQCICLFRMVLRINSDCFPYSINRFVFVVETCLFCEAQSLHSYHTVYQCVPCGSNNKQQMFPQTALTGRALYWRGNVFPVRYHLYILPTQCICLFRMVLTKNSDCFPIQH
jgi:hypothetical protein